MNTLIIKIPIVLILIMVELSCKVNCCLQSQSFTPSERDPIQSSVLPISQNFVPIQSYLKPQQRIMNGLANHDSSPHQRVVPNENNQEPSFSSRLSVEVTPQTKNQTLRYLRVKNEGKEDDLIKMSFYNSDGVQIPLFPSEFSLRSGFSTEIPLSFDNALSRSDKGQNFITIHARGKRDSVKRSFFFGDEQSYSSGVGGGLGGDYNQFEPFCFDKDVSGTCRYRTDPEDCFRFDWTAFATIYNKGGAQTISSIPKGILFDQGEHGRVRVYLKISCCSPIVQFISTDPYYQNGISSCVVDVREHQNLHPGEIAGIVIAGILLIIIIIVVIFLCLRKRRKETINNVGILPRARSREIMSRA